MTEKVLIIEDNDDTFFLIKQLLRDIGYDNESILRCAQLHEIYNIAPAEITVVLTDLTLPDSPYRLTFKRVTEYFTYNPIIVLTGTSEIEVAINAIKQGAQDYLIKGEIDSKVLRKAIQYAVERKKLSNDYKRLFHENPLPMYIFDKDTYKFLTVNEAALKQYKYTKDEFLSMTALDIRPEKDWQKFVEFSSMVPNEFYDFGIWQHIRKNGEVFYVHIYAHKMEFEGKEARVVLANDIDKRIKAEHESESKADQIERILASIGDGFCTLNRNWEFTYINSAAEKILRHPKEALIGKVIWDSFPKASESKFYNEVQRAMHDKVTVHFEDYYEPLQLWVSISIYPADDGITAFFIDITEQKKLQEEIWNNEQRLRTIINNTEDMIWSIDRNLNMIEANNAYWNKLREITGKSPEELQESDFNKALLKEWGDYFERAFGGEAYKMVYTEELNGKKTFAEISFNPIRDKESNITGVSCFSRDITEQKNYLDKIEKQNEQLREIAWMQSHMIRNHVATIQGLTELFNYDNCADPANKTVLDGIKKTITELDNVVKDISDKAQA